MLNADVVAVAGGPWEDHVFAVSLVVCARAGTHIDGHGSVLGSEGLPPVFAHDGVRLDQV